VLKGHMSIQNTEIEGDERIQDIGRQTVVVSMILEY
jgi:hypothetical protein